MHTKTLDDADWEAHLWAEDANHLTAAIDRLMALAEHPETTSGWEPAQLRDFANRFTGDRQAAWRFPTV